MMGHNKKFMENPVQYLTRTTLAVRPRANPAAPLQHLNIANPGTIHQFDLQPTAYGAELIQFLPHPKTHRDGTQRPINAYFLDYQRERAIAIPLGNAADYLFTPMMTGCYFGHGNGNVVHVAGDFGLRDADKRHQAQQALGGALVDGFDSNPADAAEFTIVGVRYITGWEFYVQGHDLVQPLGGLGQLAACFDTGIGAGQTVFHIHGLTRG